MTLTDDRTHPATAGSDPSSPASTAGVAARIEAALRPLLRGPLPVRLRAWDGSEAGPADATLVEIRSPQALTRLLWHPGELGAAQAYVTGELEVHGDVGATLDLVRETVAERDLPPLTARRIARMLPDLVRLAKETGALAAPPAAPATQAVIKGRLHSLARDRASISHHYDLSNDFYEFLLDPHLAYSSAYYVDGPDMPLEQAQAAKLDLVCRKVGLREGMRFLDIGCGWGSLSLYAAEHFGAQVTGVTIAAEQKAFIDARIAERGLGDRVRSSCATTARSRPVPTTPSPRWRWASTSGRRTTTPTPRCCTAASSPAGTSWSSRCRASPATTPGVGPSSSRSSPPT